MDEEARPALLERALGAALRDLAPSPEAASVTAASWVLQRAAAAAHFLLAPSGPRVPAERWAAVAPHPPQPTRPERDGRRENEWVKHRIAAQECRSHEKTR